MDKRDVAFKRLRLGSECFGFRRLMYIMPVKAAVLLLICASFLQGCTSKDDRAAAAAAQADTDFQQGQYLAAQKNIQIAIGTRDDVSEYWLLAARIHMAARDYPAAFDAYQNVYQLDRGNIEALRQLCQLGLTVRQPDLVDVYADQLLLLNPNDPLPLVMKGGAALQRSDSEGALRYAEQILATNAGDINALILKGQILIYKGNNKDAAKLIEPTLALGGDQTSRLELLREIYRRLGDNAGYERSLVKLAKIKPNDPQVQIDYADWLYQRNNPRAAINIMKRIMKKRPHDIGLSSSILEIWLDAGHEALAPKDILEAKRDSVEMRAAFAQFANETGRPDLALSVLSDDMTDVEPDAANSDAIASRAFAMGLKGEIGDAMDRLQDVLDVDTNQPRALLARARLRLIAGDSAGALEDARKVVTDNPLNQTARLVLCNILLLRKEYTLAESSLREGIQAVPAGVRLSSRLASILSGAGRGQSAQAVIKNLGRAAPNSPRVQQLMQQYHVADATQSAAPSTG